ncbi:hypothetical protein MHU86_7742 [Fragilaria crotonensis]|nr:hypothetical protein MHU86_7742 [Fragilaria crotonensis]
MVVLFAVSVRSINGKDEPSSTYRAATTAMDAMDARNFLFGRKWWRERPKKRRSVKKGVHGIEDVKRTLNATTTTAGRNVSKSKRQKQNGTHHTFQQRCSCDHSISPWKPRRRRWTLLADTEATIRTAYCMAVMATMAYGEFHKQSPLLHTIAGFSLLRPHRSKIGIQLYLCRIGRWINLVRNWIRDERSRILSWRGFRLPVFRNAADKRHGERTVPSCRDIPSKLSTDDREAYTFHYWLYNWFEPTSVPGVNYHDTDLLVSTSRNNKILVLAFAGTQSAADHVTNVQTFEPAAHSGFFHGGGNITMQGSLHRGFLNAFARVERGSVLRLCQNCSLSKESDPMHTLDQRYGNCTREGKTEPERSRRQHLKTNVDIQSGHTLVNASAEVASLERIHRTQDSSGLESKNSKVARRKSGSCHARDEKLTTILRELVTKSLQSGYTVHVSGHSQGGSLATLLALDIVVNFPDVPVSSFHLWTYGAPQVADDLFLRSAIAAAPRLRQFLQEHGKRRFHRFVTLSDDCKVDFVSTVTERALPAHKRNLRGKAARTLGGVRGSVVHLAKAHYLFTPYQYNASNGGRTNGAVPNKTTTSSTFAAHSTINYLQGISRESRDHPLSTDLPLNLKEWFGEVHGV